MAFASEGVASPTVGRALRGGDYNEQIFRLKQLKSERRLCEMSPIVPKRNEVIEGNR